MHSDDPVWPIPAPPPVSKFYCISSPTERTPAATNYLVEILAERAWSVPGRASRDIPARCWRLLQRTDDRALVVARVPRTRPLLDPTASRYAHTRSPLLSRQGSHGRGPVVGFLQDEPTPLQVDSESHSSLPYPTQPQALSVVVAD